MPTALTSEPVATAGSHTEKATGTVITLAQDVSDFDTACQVLLALSETVGARLREAKVRCNSVTVELKDWKFACQSHQCVLKSPTDSTSVLYDTACQPVKRILEQNTGTADWTAHHSDSGRDI